MSHWEHAEARMAAALPTYEPRPQQRKLAVAIEDSLTAGEVIMAQGGTGTGKALACLVPAIGYALDNDVQVVVSTATKTLQAQYVQKDIPWLQEHLGRSFDAVQLKGRSNYACRLRLAEAKDGEIARLQALREELAEAEHTGDLDALATEISPVERAKLSMSSEECPGKRACPFGETCFAEAAKKRAAEADVIIVNHALLVTDLMIKDIAGTDEAGVLPAYGAVVIDESHELNAYATNTLGAQITQRGVANLHREAANLLGAHAGSELNELSRSAKAFFTALGTRLGRQERTVPFDVQALLATKTDFLALGGALEGLDARLAASDYVDGVKRTRLRKKIESLRNKLGALAKIRPDETEKPDGMVRWIESDDKGDVILRYAPLHVGPFLHKMLWSRIPAVLTSATLAIGSDFSFVAEQHGIDAYRAVDAGTPFDYQTQARLLVPDNCDPNGSRSQWRMQVHMTALELIKAAGGRTLFLFSSKEAMKAAHERLAEPLTDCGITVLMQGQDSNEKIARRFTEDETSVLFGLKSFATGFDPAGDTCRLVIIDKMPFPVPSDVIFKARADAIDAKKTGWNDGSFMRLSVPSMALDLLQAAGRLIRTKKDEGMIAIFDSRLISKGYGKTILRALPPAPQVDVAGAREYLAELTARRG